jgi:hypothetical protein
MLEFRHAHHDTGDESMWVLLTWRFKHFLTGDSIQGIVVLFGGTVAHRMQLFFVLRFCETEQG